MNGIQTTALIMMVASFVPLVACLVKMHLLKKYKAKAIVTLGSVIASEKRRGPRHSIYYMLAIEYKVIESGLIYSGQALTWKKYEPGDAIPLMYLKHDAKNFKTDFGGILKWMLPLCIVLLVLIGSFCYWLVSLDYTYKPASSHLFINNL